MFHSHKKYSPIPCLLFAGIMLMSLSSCKKDRNHPGYSYFPDMANSLAAETYAESSVFKDGKTLQAPVAGTVPRGIIPYDYPKTFEGQQQAGQELKNPLDKTVESLKRGREQYDIFCAICHGSTGMGDGHLYTSKLFTAQPTSLVDDYVLSKPDGEIYHVITIGSLSGLMGAHGPQVKPGDRWAIIHYIKNNFSVIPN